MLARNIRIEEDLVDQLFNSSEKRLARTLLLLARYGTEDTITRKLPILSQETLAEMVGTTRSRVNFFMNKFRKMGFIEYNGGLEDQQLPAQYRASRLTGGTRIPRRSAPRRWVCRREQSLSPHFATMLPDVPRVALVCESTSR